MLDRQGPALEETASLKVLTWKKETTTSCCTLYEKSEVQTGSFVCSNGGLMFLEPGILGSFV